MSSWSSSRAAPAHQFPAMARRRARVAAPRSARVCSGARLSHQASYRAVTLSRSFGLTVRASPRTRARMVISRTPAARAMRAEPWPITCRALSRSRVPPDSRRRRAWSRAAPGPAAGGRGSVRCWPAGAGVLMLMSGRCLGLVIGRDGTDRAGPAGGVQGPGDLLVAEAGMAGGGGQGTQVGGGVGLQRSVGGPEQARVAVSLGLGRDPAGQMAEGLL